MDSEHEAIMDVIFNLMNQEDTIPQNTMIGGQSITDLIEDITRCLCNDSIHGKITSRL